jgi:hypothetical protein
MSEKNTFKKLFPNRVKQSELTVTKENQADHEDLAPRLAGMLALGLDQEIELNEDDKDNLKKHYSKWLPTTIYTLEENVGSDPNYLRRALVDTLINISWAYDSLDKLTNPDKFASNTGAVTDLLEQDCQLIRELASDIARSIPKRNEPEA